MTPRKPFVQLTIEVLKSINYGTEYISVCSWTCNDVFLGPVYRQDWLHVESKFKSPFSSMKFRLKNLPKLRFGKKRRKLLSPPKFYLSFRIWDSFLVMRRYQSTWCQINLNFQLSTLQKLEFGPLKTHKTIISDLAPTFSVNGSFFNYVDPIFAQYWPPTYPGPGWHWWKEFLYCIKGIPVSSWHFYYHLPTSCCQRSQSREDFEREPGFDLIIFTSSENSNYGRESLLEA